MMSMMSSMTKSYSELIQIPTFIERFRYLKLGGVVGEETLTAIIPVGFCVVKDIEGDANTIERGLVISDVADDDLANSKKGNQFVWIPVEGYTKFNLIEGYYNGGILGLFLELL